MENSQIADVIDRVTPHVSVVAAPFAVPGYVVTGAVALLQALAEVLRSSDESTDEIIARMRKAQHLAPAPWDEGPGLPDFEHHDEPKSKRSKKSTD